MPWNDLTQIPGYLGQIGSPWGFGKNIYGPPTRMAAHDFGLDYSKGHDPMSLVRESPYNIKLMPDGSFQTHGLGSDKDGDYAKLSWSMRDRSKAYPFAMSLTANDLTDPAKQTATNILDKVRGYDPMTGKYAQEDFQSAGHGPEYVKHGYAASKAGREHDEGEWVREVEGTGTDQWTPLPGRPDGRQLPRQLNDPNTPRWQEMENPVGTDRNSWGTNPGMDVPAPQPVDRGVAPSVVPNEIQTSDARTTLYDQGPQSLIGDREDIPTLDEALPGFVQSYNAPMMDVPTPQAAVRPAPALPQPTNAYAAPPQMAREVAPPTIQAQPYASRLPEVTGAPMAPEAPRMPTLRDMGPQQGMTAVDKYGPQSPLQGGPDPHAAQRAQYSPNAVMQPPGLIPPLPEQNALRGGMPDWANDAFEMGGGVPTDPFAGDFSSIFDGWF